MTTEQRNKRRIPLNIIFPAFITLTIFITVFFLMVVPYYELSLMNRKKEMIMELTNSAWSILENYHQEANQGLFSQEQAQLMAIDAVGNLHYGESFKDYFWITDMQPKMIFHPYRQDLNNQDLTDYVDPHGKRLFVECIDTVKQSGEGFVDYMWQWKDDSTHIVPKLSFVKGFEPWGWVIGTGIYLEDMYQEIRTLKSRLIYTSLIILAIISVILAYIVYQNIQIENKRLKALSALTQSRKKYKMLVEASTEGVIMILDKEISYVNEPACSFLGFTEEELKLTDYKSIFTSNNYSVLDHFFSDEELSEDKKLINIETNFKSKDDRTLNIQLTASSILFNDKKGCLLTLKDIGRSEQAQKELDHQVEQFKQMTDQVNIGVFRSTLGRKGKFVDINNAALALFGYSKDEILELNILDVFSDKENKKEILKNLFANEEVIDQIVRIKTKENSVVAAKVSLFITEADKSGIQFCDGLIQDVSHQVRRQQENAQLVEDLQLANNFLNQAVKTLERPVPRCYLDDSIKKAVQIMARSGSEVILIQSKEGIPLGIFSDSDLRTRVIAESIDFEDKIHRVMVSPLITISEKQMLFEAILKMRAKDVKYICLQNVNGEISGLLTLEDLANAQHHSQTMLTHRIKAAESKEELRACYSQLAPLVKALMESGMKVQKLTGLISNISDEISKKVISLCKDEVGDAPVKYAFITLGSVGRKEQTLATDQDNAFIIEDIENEKFPEIQSYFLKLGEEINHWLDYIGYDFCKGEVMTRNPKYCQPLNVWKNYFSKWISESSPQSIIDTSIFYDMRFLDGDAQLARELMDHTAGIQHNRSLFLYHLAQTILSLKPPISFFGNFIVESGDEHKSSFDIKQVITIITGFLRVYALKNNLEPVNSLERLHSLVEKGIFSVDDESRVIDSYNYLMTLRIKHQLELIHQGKDPDNYINPGQISEIERSILKKIFSKIGDLQSKLGFEYKGSM